ncbi:MAG TPA: DUF4845 domain-containing protein [Gammaproteobacteria bacterium]|nr:DUF4845 domain-containing protein [Gammaproteobacteria bacterium]
MRINKQTGMTGIGWVTVVLIIGFFAYLGLKIVPIQIEAYKVRSALERLNEVPHITNMTKKEIVKHLFNQFSIEDIDSVKAEDIGYSKEKGVVTVTIGYEHRIQFIKPYDIIGVFREKVRIVER